MNDCNVTMDFVCLCGCWDRFGIVKGHQCKLMSVQDSASGVVGLTIQRRDGATMYLQLQTGETLSGPIVKLWDYSGQALILQKVMRKPWRYDQMLRGYLNTENLQGSVTNLPRKSV